MGNTREVSLLLGLNAAYHESAAAIVCGFEVVFAAEEGRYTREKRAKATRVTTPDQLPGLRSEVACELQTARS